MIRVAVIGLGPVVLTGVAARTVAYFGYQLYQTYNASIREFEEAIRRYERKCGRLVTAESGDRRRLHDAITGMGFTIDEIVTEAETLFGCQKNEGGK